MNRKAFGALIALTGILVWYCGISLADANNTALGITMCFLGGYVLGNGIRRILNKTN